MITETRLLVALSALVVGGLLYLLSPILTPFVASALPKLTDLIGISDADHGIGVGALLERLSSELPQLARGAVDTVSRSGTAVLALVGNLFLIPVLTFYLLRDWDVLMARLAALIPDEHRKRVMALAGEADEVLGAFMRGQLLVMLVLTLIYTVGLWLMQLKYALAIGVIAGIVSFVPYLGMVIGIGLAGIAAVAQLQSLLALAGVVGVFLVGQLIESTILTPRLVGDASACTRCW